jgi:hypothetical protein
VVEPKEAETKESAHAKESSKETVTVFFDSKGIIHKEFLPEGQTVNLHAFHV